MGKSVFLKANTIHSSPNSSIPLNFGENAYASTVPLFITYIFHFYCNSCASKHGYKLLLTMIFILTVFITSI